MVGMRPYFLSMGQSFGPTRSYPTQPNCAASRQRSSKDNLGSNGNPVTHCLRRPLLGAGAVCEVATAAAPTRAAVETNSLRRMVGIVLIVTAERIGGVHVITTRGGRFLPRRLWSHGPHDRTSHRGFLEALSIAVLHRRAFPDAFSIPPQTPR